MMSTLPRLRFSLKALLGAMVFVALSLAALLRANGIWSSALFTLALAVLCGALLVAILSGNGRRAFSTGLFIAGAAYLGTIYGPWAESRPRLITDLLFHYLHEFSQQTVSMPAPQGFPFGPGGGMGGGGMRRLSNDGKLLSPLHWPGVPGPIVGITGTASGQQALQVRVGPSSSDFSNVGHSLCAILFGLMTAMAARLFWIRSDVRGQSEHRPETAPQVLKPPNSGDSRASA